MKAGTKTLLASGVGVAAVTGVLISRSRQRKRAAKQTADEEEVYYGEPEGQPYSGGQDQTAAEYVGTEPESPLT